MGTYRGHLPLCFVTCEMMKTKYKGYAHQLIHDEHHQNHIFDML